MKRSWTLTTATLASVIVVVVNGFSNSRYFACIRHHRGTFLSLSATPPTDVCDSDGWQANQDLVGDFQRLDQAIRDLRSDTERKQFIQREKLDYIARGRRALLPDLVKVAVLPICVALFYSRQVLRFRSESLLVNIIGVIVKAMDYIYYSIILFLPAAAYLLSLKSTPKKRSIAAFDSDKDPDYDSRDISISSFSVLEYCFSSTIGALLVAFARFVNFTLLGRNRTKLSFLPFVLYSISMLVNWLGLCSAMYQYPSLLFDSYMEQNEKIHSKRLIKYSQIIGFLLPLGVAGSLSKFLYWFAIETKLTSLSMWKVFLKLSLFDALGFIISVVAPLYHLTAFVKIVRIKREDDISLNADEVDWENAQNRVRWRWSKLWRHPRSLFHVIRGWYLLLVAELPQSKLSPQRMKTSYNCFQLETDFSQSQKGLERISLSGTLPPSESKMKLIELLCEDDNQEYVDRSTWVARAYAEKAIRLERDFKEKTFYDPLGIALMKTINVAMSFDYDHTQPLPKDTAPDVHRLRARAAKSAVRRARELYNPDAARVYLDSIEDPVFRAKAAIELKDGANQEIDFMGKELMRLLPIGSDAPDGMPPLEFEPSLNDSSSEMKLDHKRSKLSKKFSNTSVDSSTWKTNKPEARTFEVKDESADEVIRAEYGDDAVNDPIFRELRSKDVYFDPISCNEAYYDDSNTSISSMVKNSLTNERNQSKESPSDNSGSKSFSSLDDEDVYFV